MTQKPKKKKRNQSNEDRVLRTAIAAVVILFLAGASFVGIRSLHPRPDTAEGVKKLESLSKVKVSDVQKEIEKLDKAEAEYLEKRSKRSNQEKFKSTVVMGDFIAQGLYEQKILSKSQVIADKDARVSDLETAGADSWLNAAEKAEPKAVFLEYGVNDAAMENSSVESFIAGYGELLDRLEQKVPDAKIYVNSILPVQEQAVEESPGLSQISEYNNQLKELCSKRQIIFLENSDLAKENLYKPDGKHMTKEYVVAWANRMAKAAYL